jgi:hypothetical protein
MLRSMPPQVHLTMKAGECYSSCMFGFLIKKAFFDMWDNLFRIILLNIGFILIISYLIGIVPLTSGITVLFWIALFVGIAAFFVYIGAASKMTSEIADYKQPGFADFLSGLKETYRTSLLIALCTFTFIFIIRTAFTFYGSMQSILGPLAVAFLFWVTVVMILAAQFFFPIQSRMDRKLRKIFKKSFLILLDNTMFSLGVFALTLIIFIISVLFMLLIPGISALLLFWNVALKLRLYKYDYLEQNPTENRKRIPWDALLINDRERVGKRTLKGMIFPWKE